MQKVFDCGLDLCRKPKPLAGNLIFRKALVKASFSFSITRNISQMPDIGASNAHEGDTLGWILREADFHFPT